MKKQHFYMTIWPLIFLLAFFTSCDGQHDGNNSKKSRVSPNASLELDLITMINTPVAEYVVEIFEDSKGNLWFGTMMKGVARFTPSAMRQEGEKALTYFTMEDGLNSNAVVGVVEDKDGILWFATHTGLSKYDGKTFTNYTKKDGLCYDRVSNLLIDSKSNFWIGSWGGVCLFDGESFTSFPLPNPDIKIPYYQETADWVTEIMEDKAGNIWFGRSGYGACKFDPSVSLEPKETAFTQFIKKDGLASSCVQEIVEDKLGNIWFGSRVAEKDHPNPEERFGDGGLSLLVASSLQEKSQQAFIQLPEIKGLNKSDAYLIYEDKSESLWFGARDVGLYCYNISNTDSFSSSDFMKNLTLYDEKESPNSTAAFGSIQSMLEDKNGNYWLGFSGGLFRLEGEKIVHVTQEDLNAM